MIAAVFVFTIPVAMFLFQTKISIDSYYVLTKNSEALETLHDLQQIVSLGEAAPFTVMMSTENTELGASV